MKAALAVVAMLAGGVACFVVALSAWLAFIGWVIVR